jgi:hypothetical protein
MRSVSLSCSRCETPGIDQGNAEETWRFRVPKRQRPWFISRGFVVSRIQGYGEFVEATYGLEGQPSRRTDAGYDMRPKNCLTTPPLRE